MLHASLSRHRRKADSAPLCGGASRQTISAPMKANGTQHSIDDRMGRGWVGGLVGR